ncbi:Cu-Zn family superoxide dismutase [Streptomyces sp. 1114.5]|uniref:superoxide dismutase family protein n=1 Tax=Streptomyces sp. 1114.5 TaxID=1938830 RepID=UPI000EABF166|nr:superoxide dismutase family protein [Streptomyces sp. 1114.5]RKT17925.1 Cu-Zn family superoxide dismutase [Streptomyces sp. 1114.5]
MSAPLAAALLPLALLAPAATPASASPASSSAPTSAVSVLEAAFDPATAFVPPTAVSYAADLVPYGSHARVVTDRSVPGRTVLTLTASGLAADHEFPVHLHTGSCGADPASSGPHYQNAVDPVQPSIDPAYANEHNELRLLLRTDGRGGGTATTAVDWQPRPGGARSLVLHAGSPAGPRAAGDRVACVKLER